MNRTSLHTNFSANGKKRSLNFNFKVWYNLLKTYLLRSCFFNHLNKTTNDFYVFPPNNTIALRKPFTLYQVKCSNNERVVIPC